MDRIWSRVTKTDTCWLWTGYIPADGYGRIRGVAKSGKQTKLVVHRVVYEALVGPIPTGLTLDHLCRVRHCVRPDHLEPVTIGTNVLRGVGIAAVNARRTHCRRGHEFTPENTHVRKDPRGEMRRCRACDRADAVRKRAVARAARRAA